MATKNVKPFANLMAALNVFDANDLCGDLDLIAKDALAADVTRLDDAADALRTAESVETMIDFVANLREAVEALRDVQDAAQVSTEIQRLLARCA